MRARRTRVDWLKVTVWSALAALCIILWVLAAIGLRTLFNTAC